MTIGQQLDASEMILWKICLVFSSNMIIIYGTNYSIFCINCHTNQIQTISRGICCADRVIITCETTYHQFSNDYIPATARMKSFVETLRTLYTAQYVTDNITAKTKHGLLTYYYYQSALQLENIVHNYERTFTTR